MKYPKNVPITSVYKSVIIRIFGGNDRHIKTMKILNLLHNVLAAPRAITRISFDPVGIYVPMYMLILVLSLCAKYHQNPLSSF